MNEFDDFDAFEGPPPREWWLDAIGLAWLMVVGPLCALGWAIRALAPHDWWVPGGLVGPSLAVGVVGTLPLLVALFRTRSDVTPVAKGFLILPVFAAFGAHFALLVANAVLDGSPPTERLVVVEGRSPSSSHARTWLALGPKYSEWSQIPVSQDVWRADPQQVRVVTHDGFLGYEWIAAIEPVR
ncbi:MAG: hypothetical protein ABMB14_29480 [Myxococcota bacterium]